MKLHAIDIQTELSTGYVYTFGYASNDHVADWLAGYKTKPEFEGKCQQLLKYVTTVQEFFKSGTAKDEMVEAATRFGLDSKLAARLSIKNLSTVIAVAQFKTA